MKFTYRCIKHAGVTTSGMTFIPSIRALTGAMADNYGRIVCTVGFNRFHPLNGTTQEPSITRNSEVQFFLKTNTLDYRNMMHSDTCKQFSVTTGYRQVRCWWVVKVLNLSFL
jgi:hypothetical protein